MARNVIALLMLVSLGLLIGGHQAAAQETSCTPFNGKNLDGWKLKKHGRNQSQWKVGEVALNPKNPREFEFQGTKKGVLVNTKGRGVDIYTEEKFGDCTIELEVMVPKGSNSGIYVMGEYEVQILDSWGRKKVGPGDIGGLYGAAAPKINAAKEPGEWQKFVIEFQAPKFENGKRVSKAKFLKIVLNGKVIHENVEMRGPTPSGVTGREAPTGPLMFQGDHGPVAYRNIRITMK
ncbi:MAG: DUF1080 domain-containing protein [Gemmataceae bacterium]